MRLTQEQLEKRLTDPRNSAVSLSTPLKVRTVKDGHLITHQGRGTNKPELTTLMRNFIAILGQTSPHRKISEESEELVGRTLTRQAVTLLSNGITDRVAGKNPELVSVISKHRENLASTAIEKSLQAFGLLTEDKMSEAKARDLAGIAKDAATVFEKLQPKSSGIGNNLQIIVQVPPRLEVSSYDIVDLN